MDYITKMHLQSLTVSKQKEKNMSNINIVIYSQHPYCCVNNIVLTLKQSKFDVLIHLLNLFHSHGAA